MEIIGTVSDTLIAGRLEICVRGIWHAVYDDGWGPADVGLICDERDFPPERNYRVICCRVELKDSILTKYRSNNYQKLLFWSK